jgi:hypothetical protein
MRMLSIAAEHSLFLWIGSSELRANLVLSQVLRYSALGAGLFYGLYHQAKLSSAAKLSAINREYEHKQQLIEKAKAEYSKSKSPASAKTEDKGSTLLLGFVIFHLPSFGTPLIIGLDMPFTDYI